MNTRFLKVVELISENNKELLTMFCPCYSIETPLTIQEIKTRVKSNLLANVNKKEVVVRKYYEIITMYHSRSYYNALILAYDFFEQIGITPEKVDLITNEIEQDLYKLKYKEA